MTCITCGKVCFVVIIANPDIRIIYSVPLHTSHCLLILWHWYTVRHEWQLWILNICDKAIESYKPLTHTDRDLSLLPMAQHVYCWGCKIEGKKINWFKNISKQLFKTKYLINICIPPTSKQSVILMYYRTVNIRGLFIDGIYLLHFMSV